MASTIWTVDDPAARKVWSEKFYRDVRPQIFFNKFMGENQNDSFVLEDTEMEGVQGDRLRFGLWIDLPVDSGVKSGTPLKGNETNVDTFTFDVILDEQANAITSKNPMDRKRIMFDYRNNVLSSLRSWEARRIDKDIFTELAKSPTKVFFAGAATSEATLTSGDKFDPEIISRSVTFARTGGNDSQPIILPANINAMQMHLAILHDDALHDLSLNATWAQAAREALPRGEAHPIFSGAKYLWNGVIIHAHQNIGIALDGGSGSDVPISKNFLIGAGGLVWAWGERPRLVKATDDYEREVGYSVSFVGIAGKPVFNSKDYGVIGMTTARTKISDS